jgi:hypothetical protein
MGWFTLIAQLIVAIPKILELIITLTKTNWEKAAQNSKDKAKKELDDAEKRWEDEDKKA